MFFFKERNIYFIRVIIYLKNIKNSLTCIGRVNHCIKFTTRRLTRGLGRVHITNRLYLKNSILLSFSEITTTSPIILLIAVSHRQGMEEQVFSKFYHPSGLAIQFGNFMMTMQYHSHSCLFCAQTQTQRVIDDTIVVFDGA